MLSTSPASAGQLSGDRQALRERERVVHGQEPQDEDLRQPGLVAELTRDGDRVVRERVTSVSIGSVYELDRQLPEQARPQQAVRLTEHRDRLLVKGDELPVDGVWRSP